MNNTFKMNELMDFYDALLSERQRRVLTLYHLEDLSLMEIAELMEISKQAVSQHLKKGEEKLMEFEERLGLRDKFFQQTEKQQKILSSLTAFASGLKGEDGKALMDLLEEWKQEGYFDF
ncbi:MAG: sigma-70 family RNA polymerase sigma factor [Tissierellia bacterium]|nr:sigma-70 family RNA polymerase sigma factor [Tissierellia bacterium]